MNRKKSHCNHSSKHSRKPKLNPGTNESAWNRVATEAPKINYNKKEMSRRYRKYKRREDLKELKESLKLTFKIKKTTPNKQPIKSSNIRKYVPKKLIFDDLREYGSSKVISSVSNSFAEFIVKTTAKELTNSQKNVLRSIIALATSEVLNKALEKELDIIEKVQTFVKIGKGVYKVILWYDEHSKTYLTNSNHIKKIPELSFRYKCFLGKHPVLKAIYYNQTCLSLEQVKSGQKCLVREYLERGYNATANEISETPNSCPYFYYCNS